MKQSTLLWSPYARRAYRSRAGTSKSTKKEVKGGGMFHAIPFQKLLMHALCKKNKFRLKSPTATPGEQASVTTGEGRGQRVLFLRRSITPWFGTQ